MNYKEHTVASGILLVAVFVGNVDRYGAEGSYQNPAGTGVQTTWSDLDTSPDVNAAIPEVPQMASRYHLRNRATRSFKSPAGTQLASRYHLRDRATRSFELAAGTQLASRYHLRNRTARFFERATGLARVSHGEGMPRGKIHEAMAADQQRLQLA